MTRIISLTEDEVRDGVKTTAQDIADDLDHDTDRETLIERMDEECDTLWGSLVKHGMISEYTADDLVECAAACAMIINVADEDAWVEDDNGLWDGLTFGVVPSMAYFSLRNLLYSALKELGIDSNDDTPLLKYKATKAAEKLTRDAIVKLLTAVSIQCNDDEDDDTLREALIENVADGTIDYADLV